jgi:hypothetical protein
MGLKYDLAINKRLKGVGMWALGYDGIRDEMWDLILDKFSIPVSVNENKDIPKYFMLDQNYPNPFNPTTTIKYSIPNDVTLNGVGGGKSQLKVFDVLGRNIKTLVDEHQSAGNYSVEFDASKLTSGIYYYTLQYGNYVETKKMLLIK